MRNLVHLVTIATVLMLGVVGGRAWAQGSDPLDGTWRLNAAKSKFNAGPAIKSQTRKYEVSGGHRKTDARGNGC